MGSGPAATSAATLDLRPLFAPRSIAVVGASPRSSIAATVRDNLRTMGSATRCHFVNPRYDELLGQACFPSLEALPETPDVALLAVNPLRASTIAAEAARAGVRAVVIPGGGVVEGGAAAAAMQAEVGATAREHGIVLVGPNCMGVVDLTTNSAAYIGDVSPYLPRGGIAGIAQSGSVSDAFIHSGTRIGFSRIVSSGAEAAVDLCDYLAWCLDDPETHGIILFVEGFRRPERFLALADRALEAGKPIAAVLVGRSAQAKEATVAHTGTLAGEARVTEAALDAAGVIRCDDLDELFEVAELIDGCRRTARRVGRGRTGVVTVSTGEASLIADLAPRTGIDLPPIPPDARAAILAALPTMGYLGNPLDPWGAAEPPAAYRACFDALAASGAYDVLAIVHDFPYRSLAAEVATATEVTAALLEATRERPDVLPVYVSLTSGEPTPELKLLLDETGGGAPLLRGAVPAFAAIARLALWERRRRRRLEGGPVRPGWPSLGADRRPFLAEPGEPLEPVEPAAGAVPRRIVLPERESLELLRTAGIGVVDARSAFDPEAAIAAAAELGRPVALKLDAPGLAHKTDMAAVALDLAVGADVGAAAARLIEVGRRAGLAVRGLLVEPMVGPGLELIVGGRRDPRFGPFVLVGLGGTLADALDDVAVRLAPLEEADAAEMLEELRGTALLDGVRGRPPVDRAAVVALVAALGRLLLARRDIVEVDLNPVIAGPAGAVAVDALVVLEVPAA